MGLLNPYSWFESKIVRHKKRKKGVLLFKKKNKNELKNNPFVLIDEQIQEIDGKVDFMVKELISNRSSFYVEEVKIQFNDDLPWVDLKCIYMEQGWDVDNQKLTDEYSKKEFDFSFSFEYFDWEDVPNLIYSKISTLVWN